MILLHTYIHTSCITDDIITQSCVFDNDRLMLRRIAYAETRDGADSVTGGGIWQVCLR